MKAKVDEKTCVGCGLCADSCPEVFEISAGIAIVKCDPVPANAEASCKDAADSCPVAAIIIS